MQARKPEPEIELAEKMQPFITALSELYNATFAAAELENGREVKTYRNKCGNFKKNLSDYMKQSYPDQLSPSSNKKIKSKKLKITKDTTFQEIATLLPPGLNINVIGSNNLNIIAEDPKSLASVVIQWSVKSQVKREGQGIDEVLSQNVTAMTRDYLQPIFLPLDKQTVSERIYNDDHGHKAVSLRCTECASSSIAAAIVGKSDEEKLGLALRIAIQTSAIFDRINENNMIWTDLKYGNLLLNKEGNIVIADTKGFLFKDKIKLEYNLKKKTMGASLETTAAFCSTVDDLMKIAVENTADFKQNSPELKAEAAMAREKIFRNWQKEYNYQLAVLIYFTLTGDEKFRDHYLVDPTKAKVYLDHKFDFTTSKFDFSTPAGVQIKTLIERLSHADPDNRMTHQEAVKEIKRSPELNKVFTNDVMLRAAARNQKEAENKTTSVNSIADNKAKILSRSISSKAGDKKVVPHDTRIIQNPTHLPHTAQKPTSVKGADQPEEKAPHPTRR